MNLNPPWSAMTCDYQIDQNCTVHSCHEPPYKKACEPTGVGDALFPSWNACGVRLYIINFCSSLNLIDFVLGRAGYFYIPLFVTDSYGYQIFVIVFFDFPFLSL